MQKRWEIKPYNIKLARELETELGISRVLAQVLINRHVKNSSEAGFFLGAESKPLHDPFLLKGIDKAIARIKKAASNKEKVIVFGDYDADGVISSAMLFKLLTSLGIGVINHIPHRVNDGYGLNESIALFAKENAVKLIISVDCGITAKEEVEKIMGWGIEVIVIDHHEPETGRVPEALAVIDPKQADCRYPFRELSSVGLVLKLVQAISGQVDEEYLNLAAIGTITDVVPLIGENRLIVKQGLKNISGTKNIGLAALLDVGGIKGKKISPYHIGFIVGPRLNAAGRMDSAYKSLDLLLSEDYDEALKLAQALEKDNTNRQKLQKEIEKEAVDIVERQINFKDHNVIVLSKEGWHRGVLGIVASRITDRYYRPSIVISLSEGIGTASARSIDGFHLHSALMKCERLLENYGGHEGAAGLTIKKENIAPFTDLLNEIARETLDTKKLIPSIMIDSEVPLEQITLKLSNEINSLEPFGEGNETPVFCSTGVMVKGYAQTLGKDTLKFWVTDGKNTVSAVGFGMAGYKPLVAPNAKIDIAYNITIDDWNKSPQPQLKIKDIRESE
ncbi:MAG: single-stranded-DNA-specific exonuclease RecJ [Candidatus Omnitrophica bacterium]|nr:single-stranded-DNA-specific exonuclease RecJ [Candidatus Omnitrophota bacterium]